MCVSNRTFARLPVEIFENLATFPLDQNVGLSSNELRLALSRKLPPTVGSLLRMSLPTILCRSDPLLTYDESRELLRRISCVLTPSPCSARELTVLENTSRITTGITTLDHKLGGGLKSREITELVGQAGTGKTLLSLQTILQVHGRAVYVETEQKLCLSRLRTMANKQLYDTQVLASVKVHQPTTIDELGGILSVLETTLASGGIRLLVVDSIAAPLRRAKASAAHKGTFLLQFAQSLKFLAGKYGVAVLVVNQVSGDLNGDLQAALGTAWHHCVTTRLCLEYVEGPNGIPNRQALVAKSNELGPSKPTSFCISDFGIL